MFSIEGILMNCVMYGTWEEANVLTGFQIRLYFSA